MIKKITIVLFILCLTVGLITAKNFYERYLKFKERVVTIEDNIKTLEIENIKAHHQIDVLNTLPYKEMKVLFENPKIDFDLKMFHTPFRSNFYELDKKTSYLLEHGEHVIIFFQSGKIVYFKLDDLISNDVKFYEIKNNIYNNLIKDNELFYGIKNVLKRGDELFLSYTKVEKISQNDKNYTDRCYKTSIIKAKVDLEEMKFDNFFDLDDCIMRPSRENINYSWGLYSQGGRMIEYKDNSILMTMGDFGSAIVNKVSQDDNRPFGKIIQIDLDTKNYKIFSKGHRNAMGLYWDKATDKLIENENGPTGGDEINIIEKGKNYGSPIAYYGEQKGELAKKTHSELGFVEPIAHFSPAIAPSGIFKAHGNQELNNNNYFFMTTLRGESLYLIKFSNNFQKVEAINFFEIGERIRDMIYIKDKNLYLLALDSTPGIGILRFN